MVIYAFFKKIFLPQLQSDTLLSRIDPDKADSLRAYIDKNGAQMRLFSDIMLRFLLCKTLECANGELAFGKSLYGKPYLISPYSHIKFNISHSGDCVLIGIGTGELGVDIQKIVNPKSKKRIADRCFTSNEKHFLSSSPDSDLTFTQIWSAKEAYLKAIGTGIRCPLSEIETCNASGLRTQIDDWYIIGSQLHELYAYAVVSKENPGNIPIHIKIIEKFSELLP